MLTKQDYDVLIEAVEAWESKHMQGAFMGDLLGAMVCRDESQHEKFRAEREKQQEKLEAEKKVRRERSIMLRAKLIQMRDGLGIRWRKCWWSNLRTRRRLWQRATTTAGDRNSSWHPTA